MEACSLIRLQSNALDHYVEDKVWTPVPGKATLVFPLDGRVVLPLC